MAVVALEALDLLPGLVVEDMHPWVRPGLPLLPRVPELRARVRASVRIRRPLSPCTAAPVAGPPHVVAFQPLTRTHAAPRAKHPICLIPHPGRLTWSAGPPAMKRFLSGASDAEVMSCVPRCVGRENQCGGGAAFSILAGVSASTRHAELHQGTAAYPASQTRALRGGPVHTCGDAAAR
jgi:hypothetical protein